MTVIGLLPPIVDASQASVSTGGSGSGTGHLLVDGGYLNNLPADIMAQQPDMGLVIASDVEDKDMSEFNQISNYGGGLSGFWLLFEKLTLSRRKFPSFSQLMLWLNCINSSRHLRTVKDELRLIDVYIRPDRIERYHLLDYPKVGVTCRIVYRVSRCC